MDQNLKAFLDTIAHSELGVYLLAASDNGYNVLVGSTKNNVQLFDGYDDHPRELMDLPNLHIKSTAAGRYQIIAKTYDGLVDQGIITDFTPASQDLAARELIRGRGALDDVLAGRFDDAVDKCRHEWASLPGAGYGQHENSLSALRGVYLIAGGELA